MNKLELRLELEQLTGQFEKTDKGQIMVCEAQSEPIKKPWKKRQRLQHQEIQDEFEKAEKPGKNLASGSDEKPQQHI